MATEAQRGLRRVCSNYARLLTTLVFGIALVPLLAGWLGAEALGLYLFLLSQAGVAAIFHEVVRTSLVRELAAAWHGERDFGQTCDAAVLVSFGVVLLALVTFGTLIAILPLLPIPQDLVAAARWMLVFEAGFTTANVLCAPALNMFVVREEFVLQNFVTGLRRADGIVAVVFCRLMWPEAEVAFGLVAFAASAVSYRTGVLILSALWMIARDRRLLGRPWRAKRETVQAILGTFGWNTGVIIATNLHDRSGAFIINIWFGLTGNIVFGLATRLVSYIRMVTIGMTFGVDAVSARLAAKSDGGAALQRMLRGVSRMHATMAWPAAVTAFVLAEELIRLWIGRSLDDPGQYVEVTSMLVRVAALGLAARAISDGWVFLLYGAGYINRYAKILLGGGIIDPIRAIGLIYLLPRLGSEGVAWNNIAGPSWAITVTFVLFHGVWLPVRGAKILDVPVRTFLAPIVPPFLLAAVLSPLLLWPQWVPLLRSPDEATGLIDLGLGMCTFGGAYLVLAGAFLLSREERSRILKAVPRPTLTNR